MRLRRRSLLSAGAALAAAALARQLLRAEESERVLRIVARRFVFLPQDIILRRGEPVLVELEAPEVVMGFSVPDWNVRTDIVPGRIARLRVRPENTGTFDFLCDIFCGDGHEGMTGRIRVVA